MTKEDLDGTHVSTGFQQVNGEGVSKAMRRDWFGNIGTLMRPMADLLYGESADVAADSIAREEPLFGLVHSPPVLEHFE